MNLINKYFLIEVFFLILFQISAWAQEISGTPEIILEKDSLETVENKFDIVLNANVSQIGEIVRIYLKIGTSEGNFDIFIKAVDIVDSLDYTGFPGFKGFLLNQQELRINFGDFPSGKYFVTLRIEDRENVMYINSASIEL